MIFLVLRGENWYKYSYLLGYHHRETNMLHYLQGLLSALDLTSLLDAVLRVAAIFSA